MYMYVCIYIYIYIYKHTGLLMGSDGTSPPGLGGLSVDSFQVDK